MIIRFGKYIQPICLPNSESEPIMTKGIVTGWGKSDDLTKIHEDIPKLIKVLIQSNELYLPHHGRLADLSSLRTFCAVLKNGSGICFGDSGEGLFIQVDGVYQLKGIVSSSLLNGIECDVWNNVIYINVPNVKDWIEKIIGGEFEPALMTLEKDSRKFIFSLEESRMCFQNCARLKKLHCESMH